LAEQLICNQQVVGSTPISGSTFNIMYFDIKKQIDSSFEFRLLRPFGPAIGHIKLNNLFVEKMITLTDNILKNTKRQSFGDQLASQISEEPVIPPALLKKEGIYELICNFQNQYVNTFFPKGMLMRGVYREVKTQISSAWIVSQYEGEYNPPHWHEGCSISSVMYLKIPEYVSRNIPHKEDSDGDINFINRACVPKTSLENPIQSFSPEVGDMFIFPSRLIHSVNPFIGSGERRSVSINGVHMVNMDN
jgi:hypothetical protein